MRRLVSVIATIVSVIAAVAVAVVLSRTSPRSDQHQAGRGVSQPLPGSVHVVRYQLGGSSAFCNAGGCGGSGSGGSNLQFVLPASATPYRSSLTVSFRYLAAGKDASFTVSADLNGATHTQPSTRPLVATGGKYQTATMVFRPAGLSGGTPYLFGISADIAQHVGSARIHVDHVVYTLDAWRP